MRSLLHHCDRARMLVWRGGFCFGRIDGTGMVRGEEGERVYGWGVWMVGGVVAFR